MWNHIKKSIPYNKKTHLLPPVRNIFKNKKITDRGRLLSAGVSLCCLIPKKKKTSQEKGHCFTFHMWLSDDPRAITIEKLKRFCLKHQVQ